MLFSWLLSKWKWKGFVDFCDGGYTNNEINLVIKKSHAIFDFPVWNILSTAESFKLQGRHLVFGNHKLSSCKVFVKYMYEKHASKKVLVANGNLPTPTVYSAIESKPSCYLTFSCKLTFKVYEDRHNKTLICSLMVRFIFWNTDREHTGLV